MIRDRIIGSIVRESEWEQAQLEAERRQAAQLRRAGTTDAPTSGYYPGSVWKHSVGAVAELVVARMLSRVHGLELHFGEGSKGWDLHASGTPLEIKTRSVQAAEHYGNGVNAGTVKSMRNRASNVDPIVVLTAYHQGSSKAVTWAGIYGWATLSELEAAPEVLTSSKGLHVVNRVLEWDQIHPATELPRRLLSNSRRTA